MTTSSTAGSKLERGHLNFSQHRLQAGRRRGDDGPLVTRYQPSLQEHVCDLCGDKQSDLAHFLLPRCPKLQDRKEALLHYWRSVIKKHATVSAIVEEIIESQDSDLFLSLVLDCSSVPQVARAAQSDSTVLPILYKITNIWSYSLFRARLKNLGRWATDIED